MSRAFAGTWLCFMLLLVYREVRPFKLTMSNLMQMIMMGLVTSTFFMAALLLATGLKEGQGNSGVEFSTSTSRLALVVAVLQMVCIMGAAAMCWKYYRRYRARRVEILAALTASEKEHEAGQRLPKVSGWGVYCCDFLLLPIAPSVSCSWLDALNTPSS